MRHKEVKIKVGDRIRINLDSYDITNCQFLGECGRVDYIAGEKFASVMFDSGKSTGGINLRECTKIRGGSMSKYQELKERIEENRRSEKGWGREFDDILEKIFPKIPDDFYSIIISTWKPTGLNLIGIVKYHSSYGNGEEVVSFKYTSQCSKNTALHDAALWLLDHSNIKKDEKADKIEELKEQMKGIQRQIEELN